MYPNFKIKTLHLEITSKCNARCPMCLRTILGGKSNPQLPLTELTLQDVQQGLPKNFIQSLQRMYMCGNYGDPMVAQDTLSVFEYFRDINPKIQLQMFTNGSGRTKDWWAKLAKVINTCRFAIDGLEDTNHLYRRGTSWHKIMESANAFIEAGGLAEWDFIVFKHNEHQVEQAQVLSQKMGFSNFYIKKTGRFFSNNKIQGKSAQEVLNIKGEVEYLIERPSQLKYQNTALLQEEKLKSQYGDLKNYIESREIQCKVVKERSLYISAEGLVFPCCWTANQLYPWYYKPQSTQIWKLIKELPHGLNSLNIKKTNLNDILKGSFFTQKIPHSWSQDSYDSGKLFVCTKTCGKGDFDPFMAQFQSNDQSEVSS